MLSQWIFTGFSCRKMLILSGMRELSTFPQPLIILLRIFFYYLYIFACCRNKDSISCMKEYLHPADTGCCRYQKGFFHMKITSLKSDLLKCINTVSKAVPSRTTMPVLQCILINASADHITFTANDMELGIETFCPGRILEKGMVAIDARLLSEIVRKLPESEVTIDSDDRFNTLITCEKARFTIMGQDGTEFSMLPYIERDARIRISEF